MWNKGGRRHEVWCNQINEVKNSMEQEYWIRCYSLNVKHLLQARVSGHLVSIWWRCFGRLCNLDAAPSWQAKGLEGYQPAVPGWRHGARICPRLPLPGCERCHSGQCPRERNPSFSKLLWSGATALRSSQPVRQGCLKAAHEAKRVSRKLSSWSLAFSLTHTLIFHSHISLVYGSTCSLSVFSYYKSFKIEFWHS